MKLLLNGSESSGKTRRNQWHHSTGKTGNRESHFEQGCCCSLPPKLQCFIIRHQSDTCCRAIISDKKVDKGTSFHQCEWQDSEHDVLQAPAIRSLPGKNFIWAGTAQGKMKQPSQTVSRRLVEAKNTTAMLTTFMKWI